MPKPKKPRKPRERTSKDIASIAGRLLNGQQVLEAEQWLRNMTLFDTDADDVDRGYALRLLGVLDNVRSIAASVLTQRE